MLAIRMQRIGRKGLPQYRVVVQDSRRSPNSGRVVSTLGSYNPHTKDLILDKEKSQDFLKNGAQPSDRVVLLFKKEGIKIPKWVEKPAKAKGKTKNPEKLRKNQPKEEKPAEAPAAEQPAEPAAQEPEATEAPAEEAPVEQPTEEKAE